MSDQGTGWDAHAPLSLTDLMAAKCDDPNCPSPDHTRIMLLSDCHPDAGSDVVFDKRDGCLHIFCKACDQIVAKVAVAQATVRN